jgi:hypothetical protein
MFSKPGRRKRVKQWLKDPFSLNSRSSSPKPSVQLSSGPAFLPVSTPQGQSPVPSATSPVPSALGIPTQPTPPATSASPAVRVVVTPSPPQAPQDLPVSTVDEEESHDGVIRTIASFRAVLNVSEKALDGLPTWGPKAVVSAVSEVLRAFQVSQTQAIISACV